MSTITILLVMAVVYLLIGASRREGYMAGLAEGQASARKTDEQIMETYKVFAQNELDKERQSYIWTKEFKEICESGTRYIPWVEKEKAEMVARAEAAQAECEEEQKSSAIAASKRVKHQKMIDLATIFVILGVCFIAYIIVA